jgi:DNA-directed RNA polymerase subunit RPC12/RpoP
MSDLQGAAHLSLTRTGRHSVPGLRRGAAAQGYLAWMREADLEPQVPYLGWLLPWLSRCINCEMPVSSSLVLVRQGGGRCPYCGGTRIDRTRPRR